MAATMRIRPRKRLRGVQERTLENVEGSWDRKVEEVVTKLALSQHAKHQGVCQGTVGRSTGSDVCLELRVGFLAKKHQQHSYFPTLPVLHT